VKPALLHLTIYHCYKTKENSVQSSSASSLVVWKVQLPISSSEGCWGEQRAFYRPVSQEVRSLRLVTISHMLRRLFCSLQHPTLLHKKAKRWPSYWGVLKRVAVC